MLITYSGIGVTEASGKLDNEVHTRNRGGRIVREWVVPTNTITAKRTFVRSNLSVISQFWASLTQLQRDAWNRFVLQYPLVNKLGEPYYLSGFNAFMSQTLNIELGGGTATGDPVHPISFSRPDIISASILNLTSILISVRFSSGLFMTPSNVSVFIRSCSPVSAGIHYKKSAISIFHQFNPAESTNGIQLYPDWNTDFGLLVSGKKVFFEAYAVHIVTGQKTPILQTFAIVP